MTNSHTNPLFDQYADLFSPAHLAQLQSLGHDIIEARREGAYVYDTGGKRYIDCLGGLGTYNLGRHQPLLAEELQRALHETDQGNFPMISIEKARLAKELSAFVGHDLECSVFGVMRGETLECAAKVARGYTGRRRLVGIEGGWYGQTGFAMSLSTRPDKHRFGPLIPETGAIPLNDIDAARAAIDADTAAVIIEPMQAENHCRAAQPSYLQTLADICRSTGALLIVDETQTGFGRCGHRFAFEAAGVRPDMLLLGEALGGGMFPIAVTMLTQRVNAFLNDHPMIHLSTFGGSDLGCRVATKALELYARLEPWNNAATMGNRLRTGLEALVDGTVLLSVAGDGLLLSLELPDENRARALCRAASRQGALLTIGAVATNTVVLRPGLLLTDENVQTALDAVTAALKQLA